MSLKLTRPLRAKLLRAARKGAAASYSPYSHFRVGAAVLAGSGKIYPGCNVENGEERVGAVAVYTPTPVPTMPCGACRQVINEFGPDAIVISVCDGADTIETTLGALLPGAFGPQSLA
jgi:cytidine deaminase